MRPQDILVCSLKSAGEEEREQDLPFEEGAGVLGAEEWTHLEHNLFGRASGEVMPCYTRQTHQVVP